MTFTLNPAAPFRLDLTAWALRRRPVNLIDRWDGGAYRRVLVIGDRPVEVAVIQEPHGEHCRLRVTVTGGQGETPLKPAVIAALQRLLGFQRDLSDFYAVAAADRKLAPLAQRFRGLKPPRFPSVFEALVNAVACQQLSLSLGILLLSRLASAFGPALGAGTRRCFGFPKPQVLAGLAPEAFRQLGFSLQKGRAIIELARFCLENPDFGAELESSADNVAIARLLKLRGIGRWSAEYVLLRGLGRLNVYPGDDVGARNNLRRWLRLRKPLDYDRARRVTARWQPFAGVVYFHLLLERLAVAGKLPGNVAEWQAN